LKKKTIERANKGKRNPDADERLVLMFAEGFSVIFSVVVIILSTVFVIVFRFNPE
jgi:hypothetical protein